jgi:hypothetical protein
MLIPGGAGTLRVPDRLLACLGPDIGLVLQIIPSPVRVATQ